MVHVRAVPFGSELTSWWLACRNNEPNSDLVLEHMSSYRWLTLDELANHMRTHLVPCLADVVTQHSAAAEGPDIGQAGGGGGVPSG
jgi:hypothetical protein